MRGIACVLGMAAMVCSLPVWAERAGVSPQMPSPANALEACNLALSRAREVDRTLRTVVDLESGKQAAEALSHTLRHMQMALAELEKLPPLSAGKSRELEQKMRDLTHLTQGYMPMVQRLVEVNAYGSEELIAVFHYYKLTVSHHKSEEESPMNRACVELADMVEDVLFLLCHVQSAETASPARLREFLPRLQQRRQAVAEQQNLNPHGFTRLAAWTRLQMLRRSLKREVERLRRNGAYGQAEFLLLAETCLQVAE